MNQKKRSKHERIERETKKNSETGRGEEGGIKSTGLWLKRQGKSGRLLAEKKGLTKC